MKNLRLLLFLSSFMYSALSMGQCTPPDITGEGYPVFDGCGDYYKYGTIIYHNSELIYDSTVFSLNVFDMDDVNHSNVLHHVSFLATFNVGPETRSLLEIKNAFIPGDYEAFDIEMIATNDCGADTFVVTHYLDSMRIVPIAGDSLLCENQNTSYITGPSEITACTVPTYGFYLGQSLSITQDRKFRWAIDGVFISPQNPNMTNYTLNPDNLPSNFVLSVMINDICDCDGFVGEEYVALAEYPVSIVTSPYCGEILGTVYADLPDNCGLKQFPMPRQLIKIGDSRYAYTNLLGQYSSSVTFGNYDVTTIETIGQINCTDPINLTVNDIQRIHIQDFEQELTLDNVTISLFVSRSRVGRVNGGKIQIDNRFVGLFNKDLVLEFPSEVTITNTNPIGNISGNTVTWSNVDVDMFEVSDFLFQYTIDPSTALNTALDWKATFTTINEHVDSATSIVVNSYDPNEVVVSKEDILITDSEKRLKYTIHFQNTGNDTAYVVRVVDSLDTDLDITSLEVAGASHNFDFDILEGNLLQWTFNEINLLDSTSNEEKSKGYAQFFVSFKENVTISDIAESTANIYFDINEPIITNTAVTTISEPTNVFENKTFDFSVHPNPASSAIFIQSQTPIISYQLISIDGRVALQSHQWKNGNPIDIQQLQNGIYYLKLTNQKGLIAVRAIEKM